MQQFLLAYVQAAVTCCVTVRAQGASIRGQEPVPGTASAPLANTCQRGHVHSRAK